LRLELELGGVEGEVFGSVVCERSLSRVRVILSRRCR
jgi:hypothetical protein